MLRLAFPNKVPDKAFLGEQQVDLLSWLCFVRCLLLPFFTSFYIVVSSVFRGKQCAITPLLKTLLEKLETDSK